MRRHRTFEDIKAAPFKPRKVKDAPERKSFEEFLEKDAHVPVGGGQYDNYTFKGREALRDCVTVLDQILTNQQADAQFALAGGAQFGKTILELNFAAYVTGCRFRNFGLYLPDDDLVQGVVDAKFRPDVVDQIDWFAKMVQVGKTLNKSGRAVNRKGAFLVTDGQRKAVGMIRGLGKVPTTFSMDVAALDEVDDIKPRLMKFVRGRLTASDLRLIVKIGTQRVHGRGMNQAWKDGSQGVINFNCPECHHPHNPEEEFPQIVRLKMERGLQAASTRKDFDPSNPPTSCHLKPKRSEDRAPQLTWSGDFKLPGSETIVATHNPKNKYYLGCVKCGAKLDRHAPDWKHRVLPRTNQYNWSFRISQLGIAAIDLSQIVSRFQAAVADPEEMVVFRCDVLGLPQSTAQALTPATLDRARAVEPFDLAPGVEKKRVAFGGLDMGDRCWLFAREVGVQASACLSVPAAKLPNVAMDKDGAHGVTRPTSNLQLATYNLQPTSRLLTAERLSAGDVVGRAITLFSQLGLSALFIDERPLVNEARAIALALNGLQSLTTWPKLSLTRDSYIALPGGLTWDGRNARWLNLKCAVVRFTKTKLGAGITQGFVCFEEGGQTKFVPCIECNRFETIDRAVREFLTPTEGVVDVAHGKIRETPALLLPRLSPGHPPILDTLDAHLITGSEREKAADGTLGDYVDQCENHFLLAAGYAKLAEIVCASGPAAAFGFQSIKSERSRGGGI